MREVAPAITLAGSCEMGGKPLFGPLTLTIPARGWTCLLGPSGVGKSTILRLIAGLEIGGIFDGTVTASDGTDLTDRIAYMAQNDLLFPWLDITGNATLGARMRGEQADYDRAAHLIEQVGLTPYAAQKPATLSGGQRQRAALVRTMMENRPIILLDEPFSALDARTRAEMQELAADLLTGRTVLLVTHDPAEAARLGTTLHLLDESGLATLPTPQTPTIREIDAPETLACQARLFRALRTSPEAA